MPELPSANALRPTLRITLPIMMMMTMTMMMVMTIDHALTRMLTKIDHAQAMMLTMMYHDHQTFQLNFLVALVLLLLRLYAGFTQGESRLKQA